MCFRIKQADLKHTVPHPDETFPRSEDRAAYFDGINKYWLQKDVSFHWDQSIAMAEEDMFRRFSKRWFDNNWEDTGLICGPILDVGCGVPRFREHLPHHPWIFVDIVPRRKYIIEACAHDMPFEDETFSQVLMCRVLSNVLGEANRVKTLREVRRVLKRGGRLYLFDSYAPALGRLNAERVAAGMKALPKARTGSVSLSDEEIFTGLDMEVSSFCVDQDYYVWTRYQFPFLNEGRFPDTKEERMPPDDFEGHEACAVQRLWVYDKV